MAQPLPTTVRERPTSSREHLTSDQRPLEGSQPLNERDPGDLWTRAQRGDAAASDELVEAHRGLVHYFVHEINSKVRLNAADLEDAVQEGGIGLLKAIARFDPSRGVQFSTFAAYYIRGEVLRSLPSRDAIRKPQGAREIGRLVRQGSAALEGSGVPVTIGALVIETGLTEARVVEGLSPFEPMLALRTPRASATPTPQRSATTSPIPPPWIQRKQPHYTVCAALSRNSWQSSSPLSAT